MAPPGRIGRGHSASTLVGMADSLSAEARRKAAKEGTSLPDGSFPIRSRSELRKAINLRGHSNNPASVVKRHIIKRARALGATDMLPEPGQWSISEADLNAADTFHALWLDEPEWSEERWAAYAEWDEFASQLAERMARTDGLETIGTWALEIPGTPTKKLTDYWTHGEGAAKIVWGTKGAMRRCIAELSKYVHRSPGGLCADYHHIATGQWPTEGGKEGIPS